MYITHTHTHIHTQTLVLKTVKHVPTVLRLKNKSKTRSPSNAYQALHSSHKCLLFRPTLTCSPYPHSMPHWPFLLPGTCSLIPQTLCSCCFVFLECSPLALNQVQIRSPVYQISIQASLSQYIPILPE